MKTDQFEVSATFPVDPQTLYDAWLDSEAHGEFTGAEARIDPKAGGTFMAWDEYISGKTLELENGKRILQSWRTTEFPDDAEDSMLELKFEKDGKGTKLTLKHWNIPQGQGEQYEEGWQEHYFEPMLDYFSA